MNARAGVLLGDGTSSAGRYVAVSSYLEAVGVLAAHKAGVNPACLTTDVPAVRQMPPRSKGALITGTIKTGISGGGREAGDGAISERHERECRERELHVPMMQHTS